MSKLEEVARAMVGEVAWPRLGEEERKGWMANARAALEAMRQPTEKMIDAGTATFRPPDYADAEETYRAMLDAALAEGEEG